jgi:hypothetical protein
MPVPEASARGPVLQQRSPAGVLRNRRETGSQEFGDPFGAPVPDEYDLCRDRDALVIFPDLDHDRSENLCAAATLADLPVDGRQMEIFPLVAIEDLFRDLEHADGMHPFREQLPHDLRALPAELFTQPLFSAHFLTFCEFINFESRKGR